MIRKRVFASFLGLGLALGAAPGALAQKLEKEAASGAVSGTVLNTDTSAMLITIDGPNDDGGVYTLDKAATLLNDKRKIALGDIQKGWSVTVNYDQREGKNVVTYLEVTETP